MAPLFDPTAEFRQTASSCDLYPGAGVHQPGMPTSRTSTTSSAASVQASAGSRASLRNRILMNRLQRDQATKQLLPIPDEVRHTTTSYKQKGRQASP